MVCTSRSVTSLRDDLAKELGEPRETHISWVFLTGDAVYKVKKPVELGFLDFSTLTAREEACRAEVELNRRLAPDVYHGVVPITREGKTHRVGGDGEVVDWAVHMRRLRDDDRADVLVARGELSIEHVDRIATTLAEFHAKCRADEETAAFGAPDVVSRNVREAFSATEAAHTLLTPAEADELEGWQLGFLESRRSLFEERAAKGRVRDGHGDVRLEHVYLEGPRRDVIRIIDGIEFNERFRYADVCADLAFLSMDLAWHGRVDLAERALAKYAQVSNDFDLYLLVDFYESYRAYVRAKIASLVAADPSVSSAARQRQREQARRYFKLALAVERPPLIGPMVVAVGGVIASGKSTVADRLGALMGAPAINTDRIRKHLVGAQPTDRLYDGSWSGAYDPEFTEKVYAEVRRLGSAVVRSGRPVILDASFRSEAMRQDARDLAAKLDVPFRMVECRCPPDVCRARLKIRDKQSTVSDGRLEIFDDFLAKWEPVTELSDEDHVVLDTSRPIEDSLAVLRERMPVWPDELTG